jgi:hypothetical protein
MGVVGIRIHGLKNLDGLISNAGGTPFDYVALDGGKKRLSSVVDIYDPVGSDSKARYAWIQRHLPTIV